MDWTASHAGFVAASYAITAVSLAVLIFYILVRDLRIKKSLAKIEKPPS